MSEQKELKIPFEDFLNRFPEIELPIALLEDTHHTFSKENEPLPIPMIGAFLSDIEGEELDEFSEIVPCFRIPATHDFHAIVYWKAGLLNYEYVMVSFEKDGTMIDKRIIGGTKIKDGLLYQSVTTIEDDWLMYIVEGASKPDGSQFNPEGSNARNVELLATGKIIDI